MKRWPAASLFLFSFGLNLYLAYPSMSPYRDAGDLGAAVSSVGVAHPPGYPAYVLLGRVFQTILPWANPLYRLNLFSAACIATSATFLFLILVSLSGVIAGVAGSVFLTLMPAVLSQSGLSEVYALNAAFAAGIIFLIMPLSRLAPPLRDRWWLLMAFVLGLGCGNHQTIVALVPAAALAWFHEWRAHRLRSGLVIAVAALFAVGFSINLVSFLRAMAGVHYVWGEPGSFGGFLHLLLRADYGAATLSTRHSAASPDQAISFWFAQWAEQWGMTGVLFGVAGALWAFRHEQRRGWGGIALTFWIFSGPVFGLMARLERGELSQAILEPSFILPGVAAAIMAGMFAGYVWRTGRVLRIGIVALLALHIVFYGTPAIFQHRHRQNFLADDYGRNLFRTLPSESSLLMISDSAIFSAVGRQVVFRQRKDIRLLVDAALPWRWRQYRRNYPDLFAAGQGDGGRELARAQSISTKIFTEGLHPDMVENLCPDGIADTVSWPAREPDCADRMAASDNLWRFYARRVPPPEVVAVDYYSRALAKTAASNAYNAGLLLRQAGREEDAQRSFARALFWSPERWIRWTGLY